MAKGLTKRQREHLLAAAHLGRPAARRAIDEAVRSVHGAGIVETLRSLGRTADADRFMRDEPDDADVVWALVEELNELRRLQPGAADGPATDAAAR